jgi:hypothetical protein
MIYTVGLFKDIASTLGKRFLNTLTFFESALMHLSKVGSQAYSGNE